MYGIFRHKRKYIKDAADTYNIRCFLFYQFYIQYPLNFWHVNVDLWHERKFLAVRAFFAYYMPTFF